MPTHGDAPQLGKPTAVVPLAGAYYGVASGLSSSTTPSIPAARGMVSVEAPARARREADLAEQHHKLGQSRAAMEHFAAALALHPNNAEYHFRYACSAWASGVLDHVERHLVEASRLDPRQGCVLQALAIWHLYLCHDDEALRHAGAALAINPTTDDAIITYADVLNGVGRANEAYSQLKPLIDRGISSPFLARTLAKIAARAGDKNEAISAVQRILATPNLTVNDKSQLHSALWPMLEQAKRYDEAFVHARLAKEIVRPFYDPAIAAAKFAACIEYFSPERLRSLPRSSHGSDRPVFVVGMPRSGTSLVEQILASHPAIFGAGELTLLSRLLQAPANSAWTEKDPYPTCFDHLSLLKANELADDYLKTVERLNASARYAIDKMPQNFFHLGAIQVLFPQAHIIHCVRDPRDTCLSCYMTPFTSGHEYTHNMAHLTHYYRDYERLMAHWKSTLEISILAVAYEDIVEDVEAQARRMLQFLNLPWDDRCARFHETRRPTVTASRDQVRQPIYRSSIGRWKHYQKHIPDFLALVDANEPRESEPILPFLQHRMMGQIKLQRRDRDVSIPQCRDIRVFLGIPQSEHAAVPKVDPPARISPLFIRIGPPACALPHDFRPRRLLIGQQRRQIHARHLPRLQPRFQYSADGFQPRGMPCGHSRLVDPREDRVTQQ